MRLRFAAWVVSVVLTILGCASTPLAEGWHLVDTRNVRLRTNLAPERALEIATELQRTRDALAGNVLRCGFEDPEPVEVTVLRRDQYELVAPKNAGAYRQGLLLLGQRLYAPQIVLPNDLGSAAQQVFQHELTHQLVAWCFPGAPRWLNEGLAEFLETARFDGETLALGLPTYVVSPEAPAVSGALFHDVRVSIVPSSALPTIAELVATTSEDFAKDLADDSVPGLHRRTGKYAAAWGMVHFLVLGAPDLRPRFTRFLAALHRGGADPQRAFAAEFAIADLQTRLTSYLIAEDLPYLQIPHRVPSRPPPRLRPMDTAEANLHWAWLWGSFKGPERRAKAVAHADRATEAPHTRARAYATRALASAADNDLPAARADLERGLVIEPANASLLELLLQIEMGRAASEQSLPRLESIASRLRRVADSGESLATLARFELRRGNAERALEDSSHAVGRQPRAWFCLFAHAEVLHALERYPEAAAQLELAMNLLPDQASGVRNWLAKTLSELKLQMAGKDAREP